jgi:hypothetical protein
MFILHLAKTLLLFFNIDVDCIDSFLRKDLRMNVTPISTNNFTGQYYLNVNQDMPSKEACLKRDTFVGAWCVQAENREQVLAKMDSFFKKDGDYDKDNSKPCNIVLELPDKDDDNFEYCMEQIGQKFTRLG